MKALFGRRNLLKEVLLMYRPRFTVKTCRTSVDMKYSLEKLYPPLRIAQFGGLVCVHNSQDWTVNMHSACKWINKMCIICFIKKRIVCKNKHVDRVIPAFCAESSGIS